MVQIVISQFEHEGGDTCLPRQYNIVTIADDSVLVNYCVCY